MNFCERYLGLASYLDMYYDILNYFTNIKAPMKGLYLSDTINGGRIMCNIIPNNSKRTMVIINNSNKIMCYKQEEMKNIEINNS